MYSELLLPALLAGLVAAVPLPARAAQDASPIVSSEVELSRERAALRLELRDGRMLALTLDEGGAVRLDGERIGGYNRRDALDRSWRELLQEAMEASTAQLPDLLRSWEPPADAGGVARRLDRELEAALATAADPAAGPAMDPAASRPSDTIAQLNRRIRELERVLEERVTDPEAAADLPALRELRHTLEEEIRAELQRELRAGRRQVSSWSRPWRHITRGIAGVFSTLVVYAILVGVGFLAVFFGRKYLERIADTARQATLRSGLVGLAGSFLVLPAFILGALALAISIVGIPLLLVWLPLFPVAVVLAALAGYLAVAHGAGESLTERRFRGTEWFTRANSYYYILTGVGLLLALFIVSHIVSMAGPWLGFLEGLLRFMAVVLTWVAFSVGFGAFLISRGGTRPPETGTAAPAPDLGEEAHV